MSDRRTEDAENAPKRGELGDRGRVPFALVGVVLLVTSAVFAGAMTPERSTPDPAVDVVVERTTADARTAFRTAVSEASAATAAAPVVSAADTEWGRVLSPGSPFRDALKVRIYVAARERFASVSRTSRGVRGNASLSATPTPADLRLAIKRISLSRPDGDGAGLRAEISNVTITATDDGRVVGRENVTFAVDVPTPVVEAHERVTTFEQRLNAGAGDPGLTQRLSARLYALAWARGYAQFGGAPVSNVIANRHVELMTNGAVLEIQESAFGSSDPAARDAMTRATASVGLRDAMAAMGSVLPDVGGLLEERIRLAARPSESASIPRLAGSTPDEGGPPSSRANDTRRIPVGVSADRAFAMTVADTSATPDDRPTPLNRSVDAVYSAHVRTLVAGRNLDGGKPAWPDPPSGTRVVRRNESAPVVVDVTRASAGPTVETPAGTTVETPAGFHRLRTYNRTVTVRHRRTVYVRDDRTDGPQSDPSPPATESIDAVNATRTERHRVRIVLVGSHAESRVAPDLPIAPVHERGGALDGPNLVNLTRRAEARVVASRGGPRAIAKRAALAGANGTQTRTLLGTRGIAAAEPSDLRAWLRADLATFRERVRNVSVSVRQGDLGTYEARPARRLLDRIRGNRTRLLDVPSAYDGVAEKARVAVRTRFLNVVESLLEDRAQNREDTSAAISERLDNRDSPVSFETIQNSFDAAQENGSGSPLDDEVTFRVDGAPPYLTTAALGPGDIPSIQGDQTVYPLAAENVNFATIPYADVADALLTGLLGGPGDPETKLETAGRALRAANRTDGRTDLAVSIENRTDLVAEIRGALRGTHADPGGVVHYLGGVLEQYGVENGSMVVADVVAGLGPVHAQAIGVANGSVVDPLVAAAAERATGTLDSPGAREELRSTLRGALYRTLDAENTAVSGTVTSAVAKELKGELGDRLTERINGTISRRTGRSVSRLPAGIPITPIPGSWYATAGIWSVKVRGEYHRFAVETRRRTPETDGPSLRYVRDGANVTIDANGDGEAELFGTADRVSFEVATGVVVVVPPGGAGVGDINGQMDEESPGWPFSGPVSERPAPCQVSMGPIRAGEQVRLDAATCQRLREAMNESDGRLTPGEWLRRSGGRQRPTRPARSVRTRPSDPVSPSRVRTPRRREARTPRRREARTPRRREAQTIERGQYRVESNRDL